MNLKSYFSTNIESNKELESNKNAIIIYAEDGEDFQEYVYKESGKKVKQGVAIGYEIENKLMLCTDITFLSNH